MTAAKGFSALLLTVLAIFITTLLPRHANDVFAGGEPHTYTVEYVYFTHTLSQTDVLIEWMTTFEENHLGFYIHRTIAPDQPTAASRISGLIPGEGGAFPTPYTFLDETASLANTYFYWIEAVSLDNQVHIEGPELVIMPDCAATVSTFVTAGTTFAVDLLWDTTYEENVAGYSIWRSDSAVVEDATSISGMIPSSGENSAYSWRDTSVGSGEHYHYWVELNCSSGSGIFFGPRFVDMPYGVLVPLIIAPAPANPGG